MKVVTIVDNGEFYSDYGVMGIVMSEESDAHLVKQVVMNAAEEYKRQYNVACRAYTDGNTAERGVIKFPVESTILKKACEMNDMEFIEVSRVSFRTW